MITVQVNANLQWLARRTSGGVIVAVCDPLGLTVEADTEDELQQVIGETIHFVLLDHLQDGTLARFLQERGWQTNAPQPLTP